MGKTWLKHRGFQWWQSKLSAGRYQVAGKPAGGLHRPEIRQGQLFMVGLTKVVSGTMGFVSFPWGFVGAWRVNPG